MKLIIQIPCLNEEKTLPITYADLPKEIDGIDHIETLIVNDGSTDRTIEIAKEIGIDHIVDLGTNRGLARAFKTGIEESLKRGADIIVNTDGDNQYKGEDIKKLVKPILDGEADMVVGERPIEQIEHFSFIKKKLQRIGSWVVRKVSGTDVPDAPSGFRAYSKNAAMKINIVSDFSYTLETLIQAGRNNLKVKSVPIRTNRKLRESRLFKSIPHYLKSSGSTIVRIFAFYKPLTFFSILSSLFLITGLALSTRVLVNVIFKDGVSFRTYLPSTVIGGSSIAIGIIVFVVGLLADILHHNRRLNEEILYKLRKDEIENTTK